MSERIKIIHTDDQKFTRESTARMLRDEGIDSIGEAADGLELLNLLKTIRPDLILLDLHMPKMDSNKALGIIKKKYPKIKVIVFTGFTAECLIEDFKAKGVNAFLTKDVDSKVLAYTIKRVHYQDEFNNFPRNFKSIFTSRQIKIIPHLLDEKTNKEIAASLGISPRTVEAARARIYEKAKCRNAAGFGVYCAEFGLQYLGIKDSLTTI